MNRYLLITVMLAATIATASDKLQCTDFCVRGRDGEGVKTCYFREAVKCDRSEWVCKDDATTTCRPLMVNLGVWEPRPATPAEWQVSTYPNPTPPH